MATKKIDAADISHHHPVKNDGWSKVKASCSFLISKATQGTNYVDSTLDSFIKGCEANKIPYWLYTFMVKGDGEKQAKYMVDKCKGKVGKYFVGYIIDAEKNPSTGTKPTDSQVMAALGYLSKLGMKWGLYTGYADYSFYKNSIAKAKNAANGFWWEARYGKNDGVYSAKYPCNKGAALHQYTSNGVCNGISGRLDLNKIVDGVKSLAWFTTPAASAASTNKDTTNKAPAPKVTYYKKYTGKSNMIDTVFSAIGVPATYCGTVAKRKPIAVKNGISGYKGTESQNLNLIKLAKSGKLKKV